MTILVTGAAGYIGSQIVHHLYRLYDQPKVIGVDNLTSGYTCNLPHDFECFMGDSGQPVFMNNLIQRYKVKQIIHCAASVVVPDSVANPQAYYFNNTVKSFELISVAIKNKVEGFVFSSSAAVYGEPEFARPIREDDPTRPCSPYGWSKLMTEQMLRDTYTAHGMNTVILRYFNVAGADPLGQTGQTNPNATHLVTKAVRASLGVGKFTLYGDGHDSRDYVHVADVADANLRALEYTARHNGCLTVNVGTGQGVKAIDVVCAVKALSKPFPVLEAQRRDGDPLSVIAHRGLINQKFNWSPQYSLVDMVEHAIKWEKSL